MGMGVNSMGEGRFTELTVAPAGIQQIPNIPLLHVMDLEISF